MEEWQNTSYILLNGQRLWCEISRERTCDTPSWCITTVLKITIDWEGNIYCGLTLEWDYNKQTMNTSIPGYIQKTLYQVKIPHKKKDSRYTVQSGPEIVWGKGEIREKKRTSRRNFQHPQSNS